MKSRASLRRRFGQRDDPLLKWVWQAGPASALGLALGVAVAAAAQVLVMITSGRVIQSLVDGDRSVAMTAIAWFGAGSLAVACLSWGRAMLTSRLTWQYVQQVENAVAGAGLRPTTIAHLEDHQTREQFGIVSEALRDGVHQRAVSALVDTWSTRLTGVASAILLAGFHWWAPVVMLAGYALLIRGYRAWLASIFDDLADVTGDARRRSEYYRSLLSDPAAAKEVRVFGLAPWLDDRFAKTWTRAMQLVWANRGKTLRPVVIGAASLLVALIIVLGVLGYETVTGLLPAGLILVYVQAIAGMDSLSYQGQAASHLSRARRELTVLTTLVGSIDAVPESSGSVRNVPPDKHPPSDILLENVTFSYPLSDRSILKGLNLHIPAGQSIGIVGLNGAGKSTLMKLLCGLYLPTGGQVLVDGEPASPDRRRVAAAFQSFGRYELSLADNVGIGDPEHLGDHEAIRSQLIDAGATDLLTQLDLETTLSASYPGGTDLSGGQWHRVALARALMGARAGAGLLILDEPTAALDIRAEADLFERFLNVTRGLTTVLVSHRLSSVRHVDRIVVLTDGLVTEDGSHDQLMGAGGRYATMFALQAERFQGDSSGNDDHA